MSGTLTRRSLLLTVASTAVFGSESDAQTSSITGAIPPSPPLPAPEIPGSAWGEAWKIVFQHDEAETDFAITDLTFVSSRIGVAVGTLFKNGKGMGHLALSTRDGGNTWTRSAISGQPQSLFGLDESNVWLVTNKDLWISNDAGAKWRKLKLPKKCARVCFTTPQHGFAFGDGKIFWRTDDGGRHWEQVPESLDLKLTDETTSWRTMEFVTPTLGMIAGISRREDPEAEYVPDWMMPERAMRRRVKPSSTAMMVTDDGGKTWKATVTSTFGRIDKVRLRDKRGAGLFFFGDGFAWPTEVMGINLVTAKSESLFRRPELRVTDILLRPDGGYVLAAVSPRGRLTSAGLPGRVKIIYSPEGKDWYEMKVDYRAEGAYVTLATDGAGKYWAATDTGMILRCEPAAALR